MHSKGRIHSMDTFGTVDGPGIRFVLFMQGCALQCGFCHNPDTWSTDTGRWMSVDEVLAEIEPYVPYYTRSGGGITVTGGEPTLQAPFVARLFRECKARWGLHTALDSSGFCDPRHAEELIDATDLVLLDLKLMDRERHAALTSQPNDRILTFAKRLAARKQEAWIRHVLIPGVTDGYEDLTRLGRFIGELGNVSKVELLPYHRMGVYKWAQLGKDYPLEGVPTPGDDEMRRARAIVNAAREQTGSSGSGHSTESCRAAAVES
ncbi:pyruvate formate-lyase-activating protein [Cohnella fermenti]|uniref:Pyruvate formate-lyase-activating enzyme n=1 Tax=Cohnella fermenti TaxID=2565925 RepID=A0A4S4BVQ6_9BACL|nr:pyruvate formate-lyase-activating protein [Cohnella fermenti]THF78708.1 pyruvate formate lyase-activating protein [Cohnella fermenti]